MTFDISVREKIRVFFGILLIVGVSSGWAEVDSNPPAEKEVGKKAGMDYYTFEFSQHSRFNSAFRSALIPGWGQSFNGEKPKGKAFFLTTTLALTGSIFLYNKSQDSFTDYENSGKKDDSSFDDYEKQRGQALILGGVAGLLWGLNIIDAHRNGLNPLRAKLPSVEMALGRNEAHFYWKKRF